jgi:probable HAF family extracellular repeat protein
MLTPKSLFLLIAYAQCAMAGTITLSDYGTLGGTTAYATGISASGQVVGYSTTSTGATHAFILSAGHMTDIGTLATTTGPSYASYALGINDAGTVVGYSNTTGSTNNHAFSYAAAHLTDIDGSSGASYANAINNSGQIAGSQAASIFGTFHGFLDTAGSFANTGSFSGVGINAGGMMVSTITASGGFSHAATYSGGTTTDLGTTVGFNSYGNAINASGQVVGKVDYNAFNFTHAFLYFGGVMTDLGTLGGNHSEAIGLNSLGQVVGDAFSTDSKHLNGVPRPTQIDHAFLYTNGQMLDLNDYISSALNIDLIQAVAINDSGLIAINGTIANGSHHFFVMDTAGNFPATSATPEPASFALFTTAGALFVAFRRKRGVR